MLRRLRAKEIAWARVRVRVCGAYVRVRVRIKASLNPRTRSQSNRYPNPRMMDDEWKKQISSEVITACIKNNEKLPWDGSSSEFDTQLQHNNSFAGLRSQ
eukprot:1333397-Amorphochlora_amoeboformis.AAC.1